MTRTTLLLVASLAVPAALAAQEPSSAKTSSDATATTSATAPRSQAQARIQAMIEGAAKAGIPTSLLESKVAEGKAKGVSEDRIAAAVAARLNGLQHAQTVLSRAGVHGATAGDLSVTADALQAGAHEDAVAHVARTAPADRRALATATLGTLVQLGYASDVAMARVDAALAHGTAALANLRAEAVAGLHAHGAGAHGHAHLDLSGIVH